MDPPICQLVECSSLGFIVASISSNDNQCHQQCRIHFARNPRILKQIDDFELNYTPQKALFYYSCDGFVYRLINRALREQSIDGIFYFRFILIDIRSQLREEFQTFLTAIGEDDFSKVFYRSQRMTHDFDKYGSTYHVHSENST